MPKINIYLIDNNCISIAEDDLVAVSDDYDITIEELAFMLTYDSPSNPAKKQRNEPLIESHYLL